MLLCCTLLYFTAAVFFSDNPICPLPPFISFSFLCVCVFLFESGKRRGLRHCGEGILAARGQHRHRRRQRKEVLVLHAPHGPGTPLPRPLLTFVSSGIIYTVWCALLTFLLMWKSGEHKLSFYQSARGYKEEKERTLTK